MYVESNLTNIDIVIAACVEGTSAGQKRLFELKYGLVMSICRRYSRTKEEAQEMLNDTFYTAFKFIGRYDNERSFDPWLCKVCVNCCLQYVRKYFKNNELSFMGEEYIPDVSDMSTSTLDDKHGYQHLISRLPAAYKTIVNLYVIEEYKHQEIAEMLDISVGTSKSGLSRAKKMLQEMLTRDTRFDLKFKQDGRSI